MAATRLLRTLSALTTGGGVPAAGAERGVDSGHFAAHSDLVQLRHLASGHHSC